MKKFIAALPFLFTSMVTVAQLSIDTSAQFLIISADKVQRLINGVGLVRSQPSGQIKVAVKNDVVLLSLTANDPISAKEFAGIFFNNIPGIEHGITIWRYKPWNSWTKPIAITDATKMQEWDVQFFYWQYNDGLYGAAVPLSGNGFRTTLGSDGGRWGSKAVSYAPNNGVKEVPAMAIAFGKNPYELFARIYKTALAAMGKSSNMAETKALPEPLQYIGWCTWNSSEMGKNLNEEHILEGVKTFTGKGFPLGWVLVDDGWFQHQGSQLQSMMPDPEKFPAGFKPLIQKLKKEYRVKYAGVWHAFDGYWNGIDPASALGKKYEKDLFSWKQPERVEVENSTVKTYSFLKPEGDKIYRFYDTWHQYLKSEGFDFIKVDNQLVAERMAVNNYPLFDLSAKMHSALYRSAGKHFNGSVINCMDMTADAYLNFGTSSVARAVEDYFPYEEGETYNLQRGNAAAHVLQAVYNSLYFSQMVYPDFDMFQSHNPNAVMHALARTLNNGPIYLTDKPGEQNFAILNKIVFADGRSIRSGTALLPARECLFQVQEPRLFKAFSKVRDAGLLTLMNLADADNVKGSYTPSDVEGLAGKDFAMYEYFSGKLHLAKADQRFDASLARIGYQLYYVLPVKNNFASFGLVNKYNAPATIVKEMWTGTGALITLYEGGTFKAYSEKRPKKVMVNNKATLFIYEGKMLQLDIPVTLKKPVVTISW